MISGKNIRILVSLRLAWLFWTNQIRARHRQFCVVRVMADSDHIGMIENCVRWHYRHTTCTKYSKQHIKRLGKWQGKRGCHSRSWSLGIQTVSSPESMCIFQCLACVFKCKKQRNMMVTKSSLQASFLSDWSQIWNTNSPNRWGNGSLLGGGVGGWWWCWNRHENFTIQDGR